MDFDLVTNKDLNELERVSSELLVLMGKARLKNTIVGEMLAEFVRQMGEVRRARFDVADSEYGSF
jgi:hypothetical protein